MTSKTLNRIESIYVLSFFMGWIWPKNINLNPNLKFPFIVIIKRYKLRTVKIHIAKKLKFTFVSTTKGVFRKLKNGLPSFFIIDCN